MTVNLSVAVQHHPSRADLLGPLGELLGPDDLVTDPDPEGYPCPWRTYRLALDRTPSWASHRLIVQDDALPCDAFAAKAGAAIAEKPDAIICFFVPGATSGGANRIRRASLKGERWAAIGAGGFVPVVATSWPAARIADFLAFADKRRWRRPECAEADDGMVAKWVKTRGTNIEVWATVPSIVEHPDVVASLIGRKAMAGKNKGRVAALVEERI